MHFVERRAAGCKRKRGYRMHCWREGLRRRQFSLMVSSWSLAAPVSGGRSLLNRTCRYPNAETLGSITPTTTPPRLPAPSPALPAQQRSGHRIRLQAHRHSTDNTVDPNCMPEMWPGTTDAGTLARLPSWHSASTIGNFRCH